MHRKSSITLPSACLNITATYSHKNVKLFKLKIFMFRVEEEVTRLNVTYSVSSRIVHIDKPICLRLFIQLRVLTKQFKFELACMDLNEACCVFLTCLCISTLRPYDIS